MGRIDAELEKAAREVIGTQRLQIGVELGARIAVRLGVPAHPAARVQIEQIAQSGVGKSLVAHDLDLTNFGRPTLGDRERQIDAVAVQWCGRRDHLSAVQTATDVLTLEFLLGLVRQSFVIRPPLGQAHILQCFGEDILVEFLEPHELHSRHGRPLFDHHHQHIALRFQTNILEQAQSKQRSNGGRALIVRITITHSKGQ